MCHFEGAVATEKSATFVCRRLRMTMQHPFMQIPPAASPLRDDKGAGYISEIIVSKRMRVCTVCSLREMRQAGQSPAAVRTIAATDVSITAVVSGSASRFVIRKYFGNVPKQYHTTGAVNTWHDSDKAVTFQILRAMLSLSVLPSDGYHDLSIGYRTVIPVMARYESWKPADSMISGE